MVAGDPIVEKFRAVLEQMYGSRIERIVLFGSRARGDANSDTFRWNLGDGGLVGTPATDTVADFQSDDLIDLSGLLVGESHSGTAPGNLADYLLFSSSGGNTTISVDSNGLANGGVDQIITLVGYNTGFSDSASILQYMLTNGDLFTN